jgi:hypothetical protein
MNEEVKCGLCDGSGMSVWSMAGYPCLQCNGTGVVAEGEVNFVQDSFEQNGPPEEPKFKVDFKGVDTGIPSVYLDTTGMGIIDKDGNKTPFTGISHNNASEEATDNEPINLSYTGEITINTPLKKDDDEFKSKGIFEDFMDGVKAAETGRTPIRFLMIQEVDELLDLYNDYRQLYEMFQDKEYLEYMDGIKKVLKAKTKK